MSPPLKTPANGVGAPFYTRQVRISIERRPGNPPKTYSVGFRVYHRSRWWPFWRAGRAFYTNHTEAITAAQSALVVSGVIGADPLVIWRG